MSHIIGLDIGGANLKAAHSDGPCRSRSFALWHAPDRLSAELSTLVSDWLPCSGIAVTMTGELADCFETKFEGVSFILDAVKDMAGQTPLAVWQTPGEFVDIETACEFWSLTAAANWHALATFVGRVIPDGCGLLIDIGSTTTDIIPLLDGLPCPSGRTDAERLMTGELVYSGVRRTPVCAIAHSVPVDNSGSGYSPIAAELFATTRDVYLVLADAAEDPADTDTADGRPAIIPCAHNRLARQVCQDRTELSLPAVQSIAAFLRDVQRQRISGAIDRVLARLESPCEAIVVSGEGSFLAERILREHPRLASVTRHSLDALFSEQTTTSACAFALVRLAEERPGTFSDCSPVPGRNEDQKIG